MQISSTQSIQDQKDLWSLFTTLQETPKNRFEIKLRRRFEEALEILDPPTKDELETKALNATWINLSNLNLDQLPAIVFFLENLQNIYLFDNPELSLSRENIFWFRKLKMIHIEKELADKLASLVADNPLFFCVNLEKSQKSAYMNEVCRYLRKIISKEPKEEDNFSKARYSIAQAMGVPSYLIPRQQDLIDNYSHLAPRVTELDLSGLNLIQIPSICLLFESLEFIDLSKNPDLEFSSEAPKGWKKLKKIYIDSSAAWIRDQSSHPLNKIDLTWLYPDLIEEVFSDPNQVAIFNQAFPRILESLNLNPQLFSVPENPGNFIESHLQQLEKICYLDLNGILDLFCEGGSQAKFLYFLRNLREVDLSRSNLILPPEIGTYCPLLSIIETNIPGDDFYPARHTLDELACPKEANLFRFYWKEIYASFKRPPNPSSPPPENVPEFVRFNLYRFREGRRPKINISHLEKAPVFLDLYRRVKDS